MKVVDAILAASDDKAHGMIVERLKRAKSRDTKVARTALLEIALLALAEAGRMTDDETPLQDDLDAISESVEEAIGAS